MDKAELIRHEIEKRRDHNLAIGNPLFAAMAEEDIELLSFIDSMQEEPVSEDLEKAANEWDAKASFTPFYMVLDDKGNPNGVEQDYTTHAESFKAGAKWQETKDKQVLNEKGVVVLPEETFERMKRSLIELAKKEQQMLAKAIDAEICEVLDNDYSICEHTHLELCIEPDTLEKNDFKDNDKVKVIIIKED